MTHMVVEVCPIILCLHSAECILIEEVGVKTARKCGMWDVIGLRKASNVGVVNQEQESGKNILDFKIVKKASEKNGEKEWVAGERSEGVDKASKYTKA